MLLVRTAIHQFAVWMQSRMLLAKGQNAHMCASADPGLLDHAHGADKYGEWRPASGHSADVPHGRGGGWRDGVPQQRGSPGEHPQILCVLGSGVVWERVQILCSGF